MTASSLSRSRARGPVEGCRSRGERGLAPLAVARELRLEFVHRGEAADIAHPPHPPEPHGGAVALAGKAEEMRLDAAAVIPERRPGALVGHRTEPPARSLHPGRVHPVGWEELPGRNPGQVDGRHPKAPTPPV